MRILQRFADQASVKAPLRELQSRLKDAYQQYWSAQSSIMSSCCENVFEVTQVASPGSTNATI